MDHQFSGNCSSKHGFTGARRPEEKKKYDQLTYTQRQSSFNRPSEVYTIREFITKGRERSRVFQKGDDVL